jgi:hypothetical protein
MHKQDLPAIGAALAGGYYAGLLNINGQLSALIVAPKAEGETEGKWNDHNTRLPSACSFFDGHANTVAMAEAGSPLAKWAQALSIGGFTDWHLPARDQLELLYRHFKPTDADNWCYRGDNPSSVPVGYAYDVQTPGRTTLEAFIQGGVEAFSDDDWYWSSTQYAGYESYAWCQNFDYGSQGYHHKSYEARARAVRSIPITT